MSDHEHDSESSGHGGGGGHGGGSHGGGHGGGAHEEHEGAPEWLISFADNVTLMMGFFVILLAITMGKLAAASGSSGAGSPGGAPSDQMMDAAIAIRAAFNNPVNLHSLNPRDAELVQYMLRQRGEGTQIEDGPPGTAQKLQSIRPSDYHRVCTAVPFDSGGLELNEAGRTRIREAVGHLRGLNFVIDVRGHVSAKDASRTPDRGMRICFDRAMAVAQALVADGIEWRRIRIISTADNERLAARAYGDAAQQANDRVDVVLTDEVAPDYTPRTAEQPGP